MSNDISLYVAYIFLVVGTAMLLSIPYLGAP